MTLTGKRIALLVSIWLKYFSHSAQHGRASCLIAILAKPTLYLHAVIRCELGK